VTSPSGRVVTVTSVRGPHAHRAAQYHENTILRGGRLSLYVPRTVHDPSPGTWYAKRYSPPS